MGLRGREAPHGVTNGRRRRRPLPFLSLLLFVSLSPVVSRVGGLRTPPPSWLPEKGKGLRPLIIIFFLWLLS